LFHFPDASVQVERVGPIAYIIAKRALSK